MYPILEFLKAFHISPQFYQKTGYASSPTYPDALVSRGWLEPKQERQAHLLYATYKEEKIDL
jgi:hypothetical protein